MSSYSNGQTCHLCHIPQSFINTGSISGLFILYCPLVNEWVAVCVCGHIWIKYIHLEFRHIHIHLDF